MIIVDLQQIMLSNMMMQLGPNKGAHAVQIEIGIVRHMVLNTLKSIKTKFSRDYGELVIACDNRNYWRKQVFPYYKANRRKAQKESVLDWDAIYTCLGQIREELKAYFPYRVIDVESAEADDVIATLVMEFSPKGDDWSFMTSTANNILIVSADKDFIQLHKHDGVKQYDPVRKKWVMHPNPESYLKEHILKGDSGDGVPNFLSPDNCLVIGQRQKPIYQAKLDGWVKLQPEEFCDQQQLRNYMRNKQLIDLENVPGNIKQAVLDQYNQQEGKTKDRSKLFNYFITNRLKHLMSELQDF
jgi:hypothetical protein